MFGATVAAQGTAAYSPIRSVDFMKAVQRKYQETENREKRSPQDYSGSIGQEQDSPTFKSSTNLFVADMPSEEHAANSNSNQKENLSAFNSASDIYYDAQFHTDAMRGTLPYATVGSTVDIIG
jgi:hypothetical protein